MPADAALVTLDRPLPHPAWGDVREPVLEPRGHGGGRRLAHGARVALAVELAGLVGVALGVPTVEVVGCAGVPGMEAEVEADSVALGVAESGGRLAVAEG
jgi:hypothetical protein